MPRKPSVKRTPVTALSRQGGQPSALVARLLSDPLDVRSLLRQSVTPLFNYEEITVAQFQVIYAAWEWYSVGRRQLLPEEVQDMAAIYFGTEYPTTEAADLLDKLNNPKYTLGINEALRDLTEQERQRLMEKAHELFEELEKDPEGKIRSEELRGFQGRLLQIPGYYTKYRSFNEHILRTAEIYLLYCMGNWLKDSKDNDITDSDIVKVANEYYHYNMPVAKFFSPLRRDFRDPTHDFNKLLKIAMMEPRHREFFGNKALKLYNDYAGEHGLSTAHLDILTYGEGEAEPTTTTSMETLSLTTTVPSSSVPTARGPSRSAERQMPQDELDSYFFNEAYGDRSIEASPSPSGTGSKEGAGKGKGRARESSSSSPGGKGLGKVKEKKSRREGK